MKDYLALWRDGLPKLHSSSLEYRVSATGVCDRHLGGHWAFATITLTVEPASSFEVVDELPEDEEFRKEGFLDWSIFGLIDVLMLAGPGPIQNVRVNLDAAEYSRVDSSRMAFRWAGRDAGRKILSAIDEIRGTRMREDPRFNKQIVKLSK